MTAETFAKIHFELDAYDWHGTGSESLWATPVAGSEWRLFEIRNSPFFALGVNHRDVVQATPTAYDRVFDFTAVVKRGGHSTYMLLIPPTEVRLPSYWKMLKSLGCSYESGHIDLGVGRRLMYSVDVPPTADIHEVYGILEKGEDKGVWIFQEGSCAGR
jgi:hypothetical protein